MAAPSSRLSERSSADFVYIKALLVYIKALLAEWAYALAFKTPAERNDWLLRYRAVYNGRSCHMTLAGHIPHSAARTVA